MDDDFFEKSKQIFSQNINDGVIKLKQYIHRYSLLPVLEKAFINDNFIYKKENGMQTEDFLLSDYITDLFLSFQKDKIFEEPSEEIINSIFETCMEIVRSSMAMEMLSSNKTDKFINHNILFRYTERSIFIPILQQILKNILDKKFLDIFFERTGFYLDDIYLFYLGLISYIRDKYENYSTKQKYLQFTSRDFKFERISENSDKKKIRKNI